MDSTLIMIIAGALIGTGILVLIVTLISHARRKKSTAKADGIVGGKDTKKLEKAYDAATQNDPYHIFGKEFQEELRNKARLDFQRVINENAMFLQQDLRMTTAEINEYLKKNMVEKLQQEFMEYEKSIKDVQEAAVQSLNNTVAAAEGQQKALTERVEKELTARKEQLMLAFQENMAEVVSSYVIKAVGEQLDIRDQLPMIMREMELRAEDMKKDLWL